MANYLCHEEINTWFERLQITFTLLRFGWIVNPFSGQILFGLYAPHCKCKSLKLFRHGKTIAVERNEFMSNTSANSALTKEGVEEIKQVAQDLFHHIPDVILLAPLKRTVDTFRILQSQIAYSLPVINCSYMLGINNSVWEEKQLEMLDDTNLYIFLQRECAHNIFAKSKYGDSWGDVLLRCSKLIRAINKDYKGKEILLISQGSIYQGLKILLHHSNKPWDGYSANAMFCAKPSQEKPVGYGKLFHIC